MSTPKHIVYVFNALFNKKNPKAWEVEKYPNFPRHAVYMLGLEQERALTRLFLARRLVNAESHS